MIESVSRRAFGASSGTYNVRASELTRDKKVNTIAASVAFLDDSQHCFQVDVSTKIKPTLTNNLSLVINLNHLLLKLRKSIIAK